MASAFTIDDLAGITDTGETGTFGTKKTAEMLVTEMRLDSSSHIEGLQRLVMVNVIYHGVLRDGVKVRAVAIPHNDYALAEGGPEYVVLHEKDEKSGASVSRVMKPSKDNAEEIAGRQQEASIRKNLDDYFPGVGDIVGVEWESQGPLPRPFREEVYVRIVHSGGFRSLQTNQFEPPVFQMRRAEMPSG